MATGRRPWANLDNEWAIMWNIAAGLPPQLPTPDQLSNLGIDFLKKCFDRDSSVRPSAAELLQHDWVCLLNCFQIPSHLPKIGNCRSSIFAPKSSNLEPRLPKLRHRVAAADNDDHYSSLVPCPFSRAAEVMYACMYSRGDD
jgi:serine/threonine protein kinase